MNYLLTSLINPFTISLSNDDYITASTMGFVAACLPISHLHHNTTILSTISNGLLTSRLIYLYITNNLAYSNFAQFMMRISPLCVYTMYIYDKYMNMKQRLYHDVGWHIIIYAMTNAYLKLVY